MINLAMRALWFLAGAVSSLFITNEPLRFSIFQAMAVIVLIVALILLAVYLPVLVRRLRGEKEEG